MNYIIYLTIYPNFYGNAIIYSEKSNLNQVGKNKIILQVHDKQRKKVELFFTF